MHDKDDLHFYRNLQAFTDFSLLADAAHFTRVPDSWNVIITDVKGSTQAIRGGRYKDVNVVGAASIACVLNSSDAGIVPFVFGGDGATLLVPESLLSTVLNELKGLQALAKSQFRLPLRVGYVPMSTLRRLQTDLTVGKYELSPGNHTAQFRGEALTLAEEMIKTGQPQGATVLEPGTDEAAPQLSGLSCRLQPLPNRKGTILSLLVRPQPGASETVLGPLLAQLRGILDDDFLSARPVSSDRLAWRWPPASLRSEVITQRGTQSALKQWISSAIRTLISALSLSFNIPLGAFQPKRYKSELVLNSDFKKFDETLRMVIDCSVQQANAIETLLLDLKGRGQIVFGLHRSQHATMTCLVKSASSNRHIHFIDGADGGYALAAVQLKAQLKS